MKLANGERLFCWPLALHVITAGWRYAGGSLHGAIDLRTNQGGSIIKPVYAAEAGTVDWVQTWDGRSRTGNQSYGNLVRVRHEDYGGKRLQTYYAHLSSVCVKSGQAVAEGQLLGYSGETGNCSGAHLHFEVRLNGSRVHPLNWLDEDFSCSSEAVKAKLGSYKSVERPAESDGGVAGESAGAASLRDVVVLQASAGDVDKVIALADELGLKYNVVSA